MTAFQSNTAQCSLAAKAIGTYPRRKSLSPLSTTTGLLSHITVTGNPIDPTASQAAKSERKKNQLGPANRLGPSTAQQALKPWLNGYEEGMVFVRQQSDVVQGASA